MGKDVLGTFMHHPGAIPGPGWSKNGYFWGWFFCSMWHPVILAVLKPKNTHFWRTWTWNSTWMGHKSAQNIFPHFLGCVLAHYPVFRLIFLLNMASCHFGCFLTPKILSFDEYPFLANIMITCQILPYFGGPATRNPCHLLPLPLVTPATRYPCHP